MGKLKNHLLLDQDAAIRSPDLRTLWEQGAEVEVWCNRCGHYQVVAPIVLIGMAGSHVAVAEIGVHIKCESCNSNDLAARALWGEAQPPAMMLVG